MIPGPDWESRNPQRTYKRWRYPGVPIPVRLQITYSDDPQKWEKLKTPYQLRQEQTFRTVLNGFLARCQASHTTAGWPRAVC